MRQTRHAASVELNSGASLRIGPDEAQAANVPLSVSLSTEIPGGFSSAEIVLPRPDPFVPLDDFPYAFVRTYDADTNETLHEGRVSGIPQADQQITLELEGLSKVLEDDGTAREIFIDRDLSAWQGIGASRQVALYALSIGSLSDGSSVWDYTDGIPAIATGATGPWTNAMIAEAWYDAKGIPLGGMDYAWLIPTGVDDTDTNWSWQAFLADGSGATPTTDASGNLRGAGPGAGNLAATATRTFAYLQATYGATFAADTDQNVYWTLASPYGAHGLDLQGDLLSLAPNNGRGLFVSDMLAYVIGRWASRLNFSDQTIEPTSFAVPHMTFKDPTTARAMVEAMVVFGGNALFPLDWGIYDEKTFFAKSPGTYGRMWRVRRDQAMEESDDGPDVASMLNGVFVTYDDGSGTQKSVGPPGSGADHEDALLEDTDPTNPANRDGGRHWSVYDAGITYQDGATFIGQIVLANANRKEWRGTIRVRSEAQEQGGPLRSAALMRAGDQVVVEDDPDTRPRRIVSTSWDGETVECAVGQRPDELASVLARAGVVEVGRL